MIERMATGFQRRDVTWYCYLTIAYFTFLLNIQGNILPFLKAELALSYRMLGLHSSALASGMILVGLVGDRVIRKIGRPRTLQLGMVGVSLGAALLCVAPAAWATIACCAMMGALGGLIPGTVFAVMADAHGEHNDIAIAECMAVCYAFASLAPLSTSLCIQLDLGWRVAVLFGVSLGIVILLRFARAEFPMPSKAPGDAAGSLPPAFWVYWLALAMSVAVEFCVVLWSPEYLERVVGLSKAAAAGWAATFFLAMLIGRTAGSVLVRVLARQRLYVLTVATALIGFTLYWLAPAPATAITGLFALGLGISLLYPLSAGSAIAAAGALGEKAGTRLTVAVGVAILTMPALLGLAADLVGLHAAHLIMPMLALLSGAAYIGAAALERQGRANGRASA